MRAPVCFSSQVGPLCPGLNEGYCQVARRRVSPTGRKDIWVLVDSCTRCGQHTPIHPDQLSYVEQDWITRWNRHCIEYYSDDKV
jgi:hypothetical protein